MIAAISARKSTDHILPSCRSCNARKNRRTAEEYIRTIKGDAA